jgi:hypothetical protein
LKRRREIQAKLEGVVEEMSQEQREVVDHKLFVGDRGGLKKLKTETRRMVKTWQAGGFHVWTTGEEDPGEGGSWEKTLRKRKWENLRVVMMRMIQILVKLLLCLWLERGNLLKEVIRKGRGNTVGASTSMKTKQEV